MNDLVAVLWLFLPAGIANASPIFLSHWPVIKNWNAPMDFGRQFRGRPIFGPNKTWRGLIGGMLLGILTIWLQRYGFQNNQAIRDISLFDYSSSLLVPLGALLGFGALAGDAIESFFKRQVGVKPGQSWFPFDQIDYIIGGWLAAAFIVRIDIYSFLLLIAAWTVIHLIVSYIGFRLHLKDKPI